jgi:hypothetical protein
MFLSKQWNRVLREFYIKYMLHQNKNRKGIGIIQADLSYCTYEDEYNESELFN